MADPLDAKSLARSAAASTHVVSLSLLPQVPFLDLHSQPCEILGANTPPSVTPKLFVIQALENARDFHHSAQDSLRAAKHTGNHAQYTLRAIEDTGTHAQNSLHTAEDTVNHTEHSPISDEIESQQSPTNDDDSPALLFRHDTKRKRRVSDSSASENVSAPSNFFETALASASGPTTFTPSTSAPEIGPRPTTTAATSNKTVNRRTADDYASTA